ncbi:enoyl-CoA hydratase/isomerase family protein [Candidimonas sp. SYP-B2681]|uniref:enoyl-CoA hydratase/isomerase family protein n=1 Tax=Candidimonas sp. SYP-B2681 TaxID=2497686 RepID=UPI000F86692B|nr:enoyl-CoA hydratase/isomerase family protein [Candidimonas sp. SYP-B2681]RTZ41515.1 enoyl-CoA hydratase/isomerase family protein [Candidimonas sp. SYP-B2681]
MSEQLKIEREPNCWSFILNRPEKRNALSADLVEALIEGVDSAHAENVPLLVFRGEGKNLSAGFDFTGYEDQSEGDLVLRMVRIEHLLQLVAGSPALTVALAHGRNFGAGVDLFAACKQRHCTPDTSFRMPGLKFGLILGTRRFRTIVGADNALSILGTARSFEAQEALRIGFVHQIAVDADWQDPLAQARQMAVALDRETRASLYQALDMGDADADMAALVRSASRPQFKVRIKEYLGD